MDPVTSATGGRRAWIYHAIALLVLLGGAPIASQVLSGLSSIATLPLVGELRIASNRFEVFNTNLLLIYIVAVLGLNILVHSGLVSIGHSAIFAFGAYFLGITTVTYEWSFLVAFVSAVIASAVLGILLGLPGTRLGLFTLAMVTLGYAVSAQKLALEWRDLTGGGTGFHGLGLPGGFDSPEEYYWLLVGVVIVAYVATHNLLRSSFGRGSLAVATSEVAAQSLGIHPNFVKIRSFAVSAAFAGAAGALYGPLVGFVAPESFSVELAILFLLMVLFGGTGTLAGPIIGAVILFRIPLEAERVSSQPGDFALIVYGLALLLLVWVSPGGVLEAVKRVRTRVQRALSRRRSDERVGDGGEEPAEPDGSRGRAELLPPGFVESVDRGGTAAGATGERIEEPVFTARDVSVQLGGLQILDGLELQVEAGQVHALIGPNGSGKTTFLNVASGFLIPDAGDVEIAGEPILSLAAHARVERGLARTFQTPEILGSMTCTENVLTALDRTRSTGPWRELARFPSARREERSLYGRAEEIVEAVGLGERTQEPAQNLPPGERRLLELARVIALKPRLIMMDEPAAGLTGREVDRLAEMIDALRDAGIATLLVEHHVEMVLRLADVVTVIDYGRVIAHGTPDEVRHDPRVQRAYLGQAGDEVAADELAVDQP